MAEEALVPLRVAGALSGVVFVNSIEQTTVQELKQEVASLLGKAAGMLHRTYSGEHALMSSPGLSRRILTSGKQPKPVHCSCFPWMHAT